MEKPDYEYIKQLETELGLVPLPSLVVDATDPGPIKVLVDTAYDRMVDHALTKERVDAAFAKAIGPLLPPRPVEKLPTLGPDGFILIPHKIDDCVKNPRWWEE